MSWDDLGFSIRTKETPWIRAPRIPNPPEVLPNFRIRFYWVFLVVCTCVGHAWTLPVHGNDLEEARTWLRTGEYEKTIAASKAQVEKRVWNEAWPRLLIEAYLAIGEYERAHAEFETAVDRFGDSLRLRLLGVHVYRMVNQPAQADKQLDAIEGLLQRTPWRYANRNDLVPVGEFYLLRGEDPKQVLKICFDQAIKLDPKNLEAYVATARMALAKQDAQVAAQALEKALSLAPEDAEVLFLAARAWKDTERGEKEQFLARSLQANPKYLPAMFAAVERQMNGERYLEANDILDQSEKIHSRHPLLWSLRAAIAHLRGEYELEGNARRKALEPWNLNPEVDHTIGRHLSLHYRFAEGVEYQRRALAMDFKYAPARAQLAQDLLRLGETDEGWALVDGIRQSDPYDVSIYNLKQLQSKLSKFTTLEAPGFIVRMDTREAEIYGEDVLALLAEARETLVPKFGVQLLEPIYVEIFPRQQDFAIRTFGLPGGEGFLGVCFGRLITANSPAALQVDTNWRSVLWHEYCHVITLQKTKNKMPRWLSEGISVYEEQQRNAAWGERLDTTYREMLLGDDLVPISRLSSAFLSPKSALHLQFAYYTSALAVEFWIDRFGQQGLDRLLADLAIGMRQDEALARLPGSLQALDQDFLEFAKSRALQMAPETDFTAVDEADSEGDASLSENPRSYWQHRRALDKAIQQEDWSKAQRLADLLISLWPDDSSDDGVYWRLAKICRSTGDANAEYQALTQLAQRAKAPREGLLRYVELATQRQQWENAFEICELLQGIDPVSERVQEWRSQVSEHVSRPDKTLSALRALNAMDPVDPASVRYRMARASLALGQRSQAKRFCLQALEESPRFNEALVLLLELKASDASP